MPSPLEETHFRNWEQTISGICANYPNASVLASNSSAAYLRQQCRIALQNFCNSQWPSTVSRETAELVRREFVWSDQNVNEVYVGPRRTKKKDLRVSIESNNSLPSYVSTLPPISCADPTTTSAIFHLKNLDLIPMPIELTDLHSDPAELSALYPNTILTPGTKPGSYTLL